jgi:proteasome accessory factor B
MPRLVSELQWHPSQNMRPLADGELELSLDLGSLEEIERWVLSWGEHATVLEPAELRKMIRKAAQAMLADE